MKMVVERNTTYNLCKLSEKEAKFIRDSFQNPLMEDESKDCSEMREKIFTILDNALRGNKDENVVIKSERSKNV